MKDKETPVMQNPIEIGTAENVLKSEWLQEQGIDPKAQITITVQEDPLESMYANGWTEEGLKKAIQKGIDSGVAESLETAEAFNERMRKKVSIK